MITVYLYVLSFAIVLPVMCSEWAYSKYFDDSDKVLKEDLEKRVIAANTQRVSQAEHYLSTLDANHTLARYRRLLQQNTNNIVALAIGVVTVRRTAPDIKLNYLTQVMTHLDKIVKKDTKFQKKALFICNTFAGPGEHEEAKTLSKFFPVQMKYPQNDAAASIMDKFEKEKADYAYCLYQALEYNPKYVLIVEDDAIPKDYMLEVLSYLLSDVVEYKYEAGDHVRNVQQWAYLKLFYPERWQGYANEGRRLLELLAVASLGGSVFLFIYLKTRQRVSSRTEQALVFTVGAIYFTVSAVLVGRQYLVEWRRVSRYTYTVIPAPGCCSPAILYTSDMAKQMAHYFDTIKCNAKFPIDFAMDTFALERKYKRYLVEPNLMNHIGMFSSMKSKNKHPEEFLF